MAGTYSEPKHLSVFVSGNRNSENWTQASKASDFFLFKGYIDALLSRMGIDKSKTKPLQSDVFAEGVQYVIGNETLVEFGTVKKSILKYFDIKQEVLYADLNWNLVLKLVSTKLKFQDIPKFPEVRRDFSMLIDEAVSFDSIYQLAKQTEKNLLKNVQLFDVYQGDSLPEGKKSYAVSFILQDNSKTLTDEQIDAVMNNLQEKLTSELGVSLR
jgi:phenylalanyl-tRNA synthetase beta chain